MSTDPPSDSPPSPPDIEDIRPPGYWGRHPLTKIVAFAALGAGLVSPRVEGDGGVLLSSVCVLVIMSMAIVASIDHMRGLVTPLPGRDFRLISPIATLVWGTVMFLAAVLVVLDVWLTTGDPSPWIGTCAWFLVALGVAGLFIQIASLSDQWPDKWRPPYARQAVPSAPADGAEPGPPRHDHAADTPSDGP